MSWRFGVVHDTRGEAGTRVPGWLACAVMLAGLILAPGAWTSDETSAPALLSSGGVNRCMGDIHLIEYPSDETEPLVWIVRLPVGTLQMEGDVDSDSPGTRMRILILDARP